MPDYSSLLSTLRPQVSGQRVIQSVETYRPYPLRQSFSSYTKGIEWLAARYEAAGLQSEVLRFPADGRTVYADRHFPLAWDIEEGWMEVHHPAIAIPRLADYADDSYGIIPFSADSRGIQAAVLMTEDAVRNRQRPGSPFMVLYTRAPEPPDVQWAIEQGAVAVVATHRVAPDQVIAYDARKWFNATFGEGHIDRRHATLPGYSITPRQADALLAAYNRSGPLPVRFLLKSRTYEGSVPLVTACIRGTELSKEEIWLSAHAYEPNATNNCAGVAMCLEAAEVITKAVRSGALLPPRRTIRFLHGMETFGVYAYAMKHPELMKRVLCGMSIDGIGSVDRNGVKERFCHVRNSTLHPSFGHALTHYAIADCAQQLNVEVLSGEGSPTNDDVLNDPMFGPAWGLLYGKMYETAGYYHANADAPDMLCPTRLKECAVMEGAWSSYLAGAGTMEAHELALLSRNAALCWLNDVLSRSLSVRQPTPQANRQRSERLRCYTDLAIAAGVGAIQSVLPLARAEERDALAKELGPLTENFRQMAQRQVQAVLETLRPFSGKGFQPAPGATPDALEIDARRMVATRRLPGHVGLGTLTDPLRTKAAHLLDRPSLEYWSFDGLRFLWLDGQRSVYDAARAAWAVGAIWERPQDPEDWEKSLRSFTQVVTLLEESGHLSIQRQLPPVPVTREDIMRAVMSVGITAGDVAMVHSGLKQFGHVEGGAEAVIEALMGVITPKGILAMPTNTDTAVGGADGPFDPKTSLCYTGTIPNTFWKRPGVLRHNHPTHSVAAWGDRAEEFLRVSDPYDTFDRRGPWGKLLDWKGKILLFGETMGANTYMHALEAWLLNYLNTTYARVQENGQEKEVRITNYPDGCRGRWYGLKRQAAYFKRLQPLGLYREAKVGAGVVLAVEVPALTRELHKLIKEDPAIFLHTSGCHACAERRAALEGWQVPDTLPS